MELSHKPFNNTLLLLACALLIFGVRVELIDTMAVMTPYWDDWGVGDFLSRSVEGKLAFKDFFKDANEHRMMFNRILSVVLFKINQNQWDPIVSMLANSVLWTISGLLLIHFARQFSASFNAPALIALVLLLWVAPIALVNILWGVQTHTYTMVLFSIMGCWYSGYPPFSGKWWVGIGALTAACLTLAGGAFAACAVLGIQIIILLTDTGAWRQHAKTILAALLVAVFGLSLILVQHGNGSPGATQTLTHSVTTFLRTLAWPAVAQLWPAFAFMTPAILLLIQSIRNRTTSDQITRFALCLFGFVVLVALAIAYARGGGGVGPARRYFEFLALSSVASFLALLIVMKNLSHTVGRMLPLLAVLWLGGFIVGVPGVAYSIQFTIEDREALKPVQEELVKRYLNTRDPEVLEGRPFRHVPFPRSEILRNMLDNFQATDVLPYKLQTPSPIIWNPSTDPQNIRNSPFIKNGILIPSSGEFGVKFYGEDVLGSYKPRAGGVAATGRFESGDIKIDRPYVAVPVTGYFGYQGLNLKLVNVLTGKEYKLKPEELHSQYAERWRYILLKVPRGYYRIIAEDNNSALWFGFSTPRTVGRLSYLTQKLLPYGDWIWKCGIFLLLFVLRYPIASIMTDTKRRSRAT